MMRCQASGVLALSLAAAIAGPVHAAGAALAPLQPEQQAPAAAPAPEQRRDLGPVLEPIRAKHRLPALCGAAIVGGRLTAIGATGVRQAGTEEPVTPSDLWHLGSDTKAMTATMLATLVEEGMLTWETTVGEVFGEKLAMHEGWRPVTLAQLLHHRGGAPSGLDRDGLWMNLREFEGTPREARVVLAEGVLKHEPGAIGAFRYSNAGYAIAGAMAEVITDTPWEDLMRERLFAPLGMTSAGFGAPGSPGAIDQPRGHHQNGRAEQPGPRADNPPAIGPAGTVHCTMEDWAKFVTLHLRGEGPALLRPETLRTLHEPAPGPGQVYAMGWLVTERPWAKGEGGSGVALTHAGSNTMWYCVAWLAPEKKMAVLIACNQGGARVTKACDEAVGAIFADLVASQRLDRPER